MKRAPAKSVARWLVLLPGAYLCGLVAYLLAGSVVSLVIDSVLVSPPDWWGRRVAVDGASYAALGAGMVYAAWFLAPSHRHGTVYVLGGALFLLAVIFALTSLFVGNWWSTYQMLASAVGAGGVCSMDLSGRFSPPDEQPGLGGR